MELKTDALVLRTADYGDCDRMVTLLTADRGKLSAAAKGVRKANAKLRFAAQPFCFAQYVLAERGERYTVVGAELYDGFFSLASSLESYYAAAALLEVCDKLVYENMESGRLLVAAVGALKEFGGEPRYPLVKFLVRALGVAGYPVSAGDCPVCGRRPAHRMRFDMNGGAFFCEGCGEGVPASESTYSVLRAEAEGGELRDPDGAKRALRLLGAYFTHHTEVSLPALEAYLSLI